MIKDEVEREYFEWLCSLICKDECISYMKLLTFLHNEEFFWLLDRDSNRADDGVELRHRFAYYFLEGAEDYLTGPCSVFEMLVGLALRCEEDIMDNPAYGDRTPQWFWQMIVNLGLGSMTDDRFDKDYCIFVIDRFMNREYEPNGKGGLFTIRGCEEDLTEVEIWYQLNWYLNTIT